MNGVCERGDPAWFIGGPKDCEAIYTDGSECIMVAERPNEPLSCLCCLDVASILSRTTKTSSYTRQRFQCNGHRHRFVYVHETEGNSLILSALAEAILLFSCPSELEDEGRRVTSELPRDLRPYDRRNGYKPAKRLAAFGRLFEHRLRMVATYHGL